MMFDTSKIGGLNEFGGLKPLKRGGIQRCHHHIEISSALLMRVLSVKKCFYEDVNTRLSFINNMTDDDKKQLASWLIKETAK